ncbi:MAG: cell division ATP-binding protein FtsE [candidate division Zixibacteria bacterium]|nr:cell division ATP-binding protein FtsE [candidate division Zixibacteria bacterium]
MLIIRNLKKVYNQGDPILSDVSLELGKGEMAFLVGPSGAGKSTLIKMIYLEEKPDAGEILLGNYNFTHIKDKQIPRMRRQLGVIFQDFKLISERTAWENVALALEVVGKPKRVISNKVSDLLRLVGLLHRKHNYPDQLSGGECQRVATARALANEPLLLLADEPTGNLDHDNSQSLLKLLAKINVQGCSILMATHNMNLIEGLPQRRLYLEDGLVRENES